jgi:elongation factor P
LNIFGLILIKEFSLYNFKKKRIKMISAGDLKRKDMVIIDQEPYKVLEITVSSPSARGASTMVKAKVRHLLNSSVQDKTFKSTDKFQEADVLITEADYLYKDVNGYSFMDQQTFEMVELSSDLVGEYDKYLQENLRVKILIYNGIPVSVELPQYVNLKVEEADISSQQAGAAGSGTKNAVLETGLQVKVPQYIQAGQIVKVNTETGEVAGRA